MFYLNIPHIISPLQSALKEKQCSTAVALVPNKLALAGNQELLAAVGYIDHSKALDILDCTLLFNDIKLNWDWGEGSQLVTVMLEKVHSNPMLSRPQQEQCQRGAGLSRTGERGQPRNKDWASGVVQDAESIRDAGGEMHVDPLQPHIIYR